MCCCKKKKPNPWHYSPDWHKPPLIRMNVTYNWRKIEWHLWFTWALIPHPINLTFSHWKNKWGNKSLLLSRFTKHVCPSTMQFCVCYAKKNIIVTLNITGRNFKRYSCRWNYDAITGLISCEHDRSTRDCTLSCCNRNRLCSRCEKAASVFRIWKGLAAWHS